jgi:hypothetical protein
MASPAPFTMQPTVPSSLIVGVAEGPGLRVAEEGVVVEAELGVQGQEAPVGGDHQGVDLGQRAVAGDERHVQPADGGRAGLGEVPVQVEPEGEPADLERQQAQRGIGHRPEDLLRRAGGDLLDVHAARLGRHHDGRPGLPVEGDGQVQLAGDGERLLDQHLLDDDPLGGRLRRAEAHPEDPAGGGLGLGRRPGHRDAPRLAAAAGVDLGLHHHLAAQPRGRRPGRLRGVGHLAPRHGDAELLQERLGLVLVDAHGPPAPTSR